VARLEAYYELLESWNAKINLTGLDLTVAAAFDRLLVEPLIAARYVERAARRGIDIGSGGGSPAIPLLLASRALRMVLVESKTRKSVFLREALRVLELDQCEVVTSRFEQLLTRPELHEAHDVLTVRAVRVEPRILMSLQAFVKPSGQLLWFRTSSQVETVPLPPPLAWKATHALVESLGSRLVVLEKGRVGTPAAVS
jgi:16S rRNA (guanine527-N7)-methyltransferase